MNKYKAGQMVTLGKQIELENAITKEKVIIEPGATGFVTASGFVHITGPSEHFGNVIKLNNDCIVDGHDTTAIAKRIAMTTFGRYNLDDLLDDYEIDYDDFQDTIEGVLIDVFM